MKVNVTQYMRPNGRRVEHAIEVRDECSQKYQDILDCNANLSTEQLMTGAVSQTIECADGDFDIILTFGKDYDENKEALEKMILRFNKTTFLVWQKQVVA